MADDFLQQTKTCTKCGEVKPADLVHFRRSNRVKCGLRPICRPCENAYRRSVYIPPDEEAGRKKAQYDKEYRRKRREEIRRKDRERCKMEREVRRERHRRWTEANREHVRRERAATEARRRARKKGAGGSVTSADITRIAWLQGLKCFYCEEVLSKFHADHFIPIARGGNSDPGNIVAACSACNLKKHTALPWEWMPHRFAEGCSPR